MFFCSRLGASPDLRRMGWRRFVVACRNGTVRLPNLAEVRGGERREREGNGEFFFFWFKLWGGVTLWIDWMDGWMDGFGGFVDARVSRVPKIEVKMGRKEERLDV